MSKKLTIETIKQKLIDTTRPIELISTEYINNNTHMLWKCLKEGCQHEWKATQNVIDRGRGCPQCRRWTVEKVNKKLKELKSNIKLLTVGTITIKDKLLWQCTECGHEWRASLSHILFDGSTCVPCRRWTIDKIKAKLTDLESTVRVLSKTITKARDKLEWECLLCGHLWFARKDRIVAGKASCPKCASVYHNKKNAEKHKKTWKKIKTLVYIIKCSSLSTTEEFYKIGLTSTKVKYRFSGKNIPYEYEILKEIHTTKYDATYLEIALHKYNKEYVYKPKIYFEGHTECFSKLGTYPNNIQELKNKEITNA